MAAVVLTSCGGESGKQAPDPVQPQYLVTERVTEFIPAEPPTVVAEAPAVETEAPDPWTEDELYAMALTLAGECYEDKPHDKRKVCETILNRVSTEGFPDDIISVLTYPNAFCGYWTQSREISENDYAIAEQALRDWYDNGCQPLSSYLFFEAGPNRENVFRDEF